MYKLRIVRENNEHVRGRGRSRERGRGKNRVVATRNTPSMEPINAVALVPDNEVVNIAALTVNIILPLLFWQVHRWKDCRSLGRSK